MMPFELLGLGEVLWDLLPSGPRLGGAPCNFVFHCNQLGHSSAIVSRIGADRLGAELRNELQSLGVASEFVQEDAEHPTGTVTVEIDSAGQPKYTITESVAWDFVEPRPEIAPTMQNAQVICFGSLAQRHERSRTTIQGLLRGSRSSPGKRVHVFDVNLRQHFYSAELLDASLKLSDWVKLNEEELTILANLLGLTGVSHESTVAALRDRYKLALVCMTRGERGCLVQTGAEEIDEPGVLVQVADTVGAGDAFTAGLACLTLEGKPLRTAVRFANKYAARVAASVGATPRIDRKSIEHE